jgi:hypothetical protein
MERTTRATAQTPAIPGDIEDPEVQKATGVVELPLHIRWSGPPRRYDLSDRRQRARVYEQVLREGNRAWTEWLHRHRGLVLPC